MIETTSKKKTEMKAEASKKKPKAKAKAKTKAKTKTEDNSNGAGGEELADEPESKEVEPTKPIKRPASQVLKRPAKKSEPEGSRQVAGYRLHSSSRKINCFSRFVLFQMVWFYHGRPKDQQPLLVQEAGEDAMGHQNQWPGEISCFFVWILFFVFGHCVVGKNNTHTSL